MSVGQKLLDVPFPEMVYKLASAIAESQFKLDMESIEILRVMGDKENYPVSLPTVRLDGRGKVMEGDDITTSMIGAGFQPTFYQFSETMIEVQMTISMSSEGTSERKVKGTSYGLSYHGYPRRISIWSTPIDATYTSKYNFSQEGSSTIRTRLVPLPPNPTIQRFLDMRAQAMQNEFELSLREIEMKMEAARRKTEEEAQKKEAAQNEEKKPSKPPKPEEPKPEPPKP